MPDQYEHVGLDKKSNQWYGMKNGQWQKIKPDDAQSFIQQGLKKKAVGPSGNLVTPNPKRPVMSDPNMSPTNFFAGRHPYMTEAGLGAGRGLMLPQSTSGMDTLKQMGQGALSLLKDPLNFGKAIEGIATGEEKSVAKIPSDIKKRDWPALTGDVTESLVRPASLLVGGSKARDLDTVGSPIKTLTGQGESSMAVAAKLDDMAKETQTHVNKVLDDVEKRNADAKADLLQKIDSPRNGVGIIYNKAKVIADLKQTLGSMRDGLPKPVKDLLAQTNPTGNFNAAELSRLYDSVREVEGKMGVDLKDFFEKKLNSLAFAKKLGPAWQEMQMEMDDFQSTIKNNPMIRAIREGKSAEHIMGPLVGRASRVQVMQALAPYVRDGLDMGKLGKNAFNSSLASLALRWSIPSKWDLFAMGWNPKAGALRMGTAPLLRNYVLHGLDLGKYAGVRAAPTAAGAIAAIGAASGDPGTESAH